MSTASARVYVDFLRGLLFLKDPQALDRPLYVLLLSLQYLVFRNGHFEGLQVKLFENQCLVVDELLNEITGLADVESIYELDLVFLQGFDLLNHNLVIAKAEDLLKAGVVKHVNLDQLSEGDLLDSFATFQHVAFQHLDIRNCLNEVG